MVDIKSTKNILILISAAVLVSISAMIYFVHNSSVTEHFADLSSRVVHSYDAQLLVPKGWIVRDRGSKDVLIIERGYNDDVAPAMILIERFMSNDGVVDRSVHTEDYLRHVARNIANGKLNIDAEGAWIAWIDGAPAIYVVSDEQKQYYREEKKALSMIVPDDHGNLARITVVVNATDFNAENRAAMEEIIYSWRWR